MLACNAPCISRLRHMSSMRRRFGAACPLVDKEPCRIAFGLHWVEVLFVQEGPECGSLWESHLIALEIRVVVALGWRAYGVHDAHFHITIRTVTMSSSHQWARLQQWTAVMWLGVRIWQRHGPYPRHRVRSGTTIQTESAESVRDSSNTNRLGWGM